VEVDLIFLKVLPLEPTMSLMKPVRNLTVSKDSYALLRQPITLRCSQLLISSYSGN